jgi:hypothetical protein
MSCKRSADWKGAGRRKKGMKIFRWGKGRDTEVQFRTKNMWLDEQNE